MMQTYQQDSSLLFFFQEIKIKILIESNGIRKKKPLYESSSHILLTNQKRISAN